jgi:hypothetical protein
MHGRTFLPRNPRNSRQNRRAWENCRSPRYEHNRAVRFQVFSGGLIYGSKIVFLVGAALAGRENGKLSSQVRVTFRKQK